MYWSAKWGAYEKIAHLPSVQRSAAGKDAQHGHAALLGASVAAAVLPMLEHGSESTMPAVLYWVKWHKMSYLDWVLLFGIGCIRYHDVCLSITLVYSACLLSNHTLFFSAGL